MEIGRVVPARIAQLGSGEILWLKMVYQGTEKAGGILARVEVCAVRSGVGPTMAARDTTSVNLHAGGYSGSG